MGKAIELGKIVQNLTKWYNVSTKVISKTKLLMRDFINRKSYFAQKHDHKSFKNVKKLQRNRLQWPARPSPISIPILKVQWNGIKIGTSKSQNQLNSRKEYEYYSSVNVENNFHWNKLQWPISKN